MRPQAQQILSNRFSQVEIPTDGLIVHYTMDNISGTTLVDETGTYDGTISGATQVPGYIGNALDFDGINDNVLLPFSGISVTEWTISFFVNGAPAAASTLAYILDTGGTNRRIIGQSDGTTLDSQFSGVGYYDGSWKSSGLYIENNDPHFVCIRHDGSRVYFRVDNSTSDVASTSSSIFSTNTRLGSRYDGTSNYLNGWIDQLRIYNRFLSDLEVESLHDET